MVAGQLNKTCGVWTVNANNELCTNEALIGQLPHSLDALLVSIV
jgi:hypothetical protein